MELTKWLATCITATTPIAKTTSLVAAGMDAAKDDGEAAKGKCYWRGSKVQGIGEYM